MGVSATNIPISATTTDFVGAVEAARQAVGRFDTDLNTKLAQSFRALDRESKLFEAGLGRVQKTLDQQAAAAARSAAAAQQAAAKRISDIGNNLKSVGQSLTTYITAPLALAAGASFNAYAKIDGMVRGLKAVTGSASDATTQFKQFYEISKKPGLGLEETVAAGLQLETLGYQAKTAQRYLTEVGNAIALGGKGKVEFGQVITQFTQMAGKAKVLGDDLKPIVNASPVIAKAISNIFGTVDSEAISSKLQAAGKGPREFIEALVNELAKVERVEGGPLTALENFGDGAKIAAYNVAGAADKIFDLTGKLNSVSDLIGRAAEGFANLPATTQQAILGVVALAGATGPLALGIGSVIRLLPILKLGISSIIGPVGLTVAAILAGAALIIANWDSIKKTLTDTGIYAQLVSTAQSSFDLLTSLFTVVKDLLITVWNDWKGSILATTQFVFNSIALIFRSAVGVIGGVFKVLTGILTLDWNKFAEGFQNIIASVLNVVTGLFLNTFTFVGRLIADTLAKYGFSGIASGINGYLDGLTKRASSAAIALKGVKSASDGVTLNEVTVKAKRATTSSGATALDFAGSGQSEIEKAKERLKTLKEAIQSANLAGKDTTALQAEYDALSAKIDKATASTKKQKEELQKTYTVLQTLERAAKLINDEIQTKRSLGITVPAETFHELDIVEAQIKRVKGEIEKVATLKPVGESAVSLNMQGEADRRNLFSNYGLQDRAANELPGLSTQRNPQFKDTVDQIKSAGDQIVNAYYTLRETIKNAAGSTAAEMSTGFGEILGGIATGQATLFGGVIGMAVDFLSNYLAKIGQANLAAGAALIAAGALSLNPFMVAQGKQKLTAGTLLNVAAGAVKVIGGALASSASGGGMKKFAKGGVFDQTSVGIFGEYAGATLNREIATPERLMASVMRNELDNFGGRQSGGRIPSRIEIAVSGKLRGKDMHISGIRYVDTLDDYR
ncbi:tape measure protein [Spirosoma sp. KNUC1025]|uniref:tape measure protein n=1 Tax=Spirosoma sp. KNUC1025 TaxID=2894082 RepID=UPI00386A880D|nr:tape measure protein [Spirosoma sp. KNUC1025]